MARRIDRLAWFALGISLCTLTILGVSRYRDYTALGDIRSLAVSPDGSFLAAGHSNGRVTLWDPSTGKRTATLRSDICDVGKLAVSHDGHWVASAHREGNEEARIRIWKAATGALVDCLGPGDSCTPVAFHPTKPWLFWIKGNETIGIWDVYSRREVRFLGPKKVRASDFAFSVDGKHMAVSVLDMEGVPQDENVIVIWDIEADRQVAQLKCGTSTFESEIAYSPDGKRLGSISLGGDFRIWDLRVQTAIVTVPCQTWSPSSFSFSPDGTRVSVGCGDGSLREYSASDGHMLQEWTSHPKDPGHARIVRYDPKARFIAYSADKDVVFQPIKK